MNFFNTHSKNISLLIVICSLLASATMLQRRHDAIMHPQIIFKTETKYILPAVIVKNFSFGFNAILADLYWVKAIQDFSAWDGKDPFYVQEYQNIATLDPKFSYPYLLGILTFTSRSVNNKNATTTTLDMIEPVIEQGIQNLPDNWEIPFYLGTGYQLNNNPEKALKYLKIAASHKDAPETIHKAYKAYLKNTLTGKSGSGQDLVKAIYETTESKTTKKILEEGIMINELTEVLESITKNYHQKYGYYPSSLDELISRGIIKTGTDLKTNFRITINQYTGKVTVISKKVQ